MFAFICFRISMHMAVGSGILRALTSNLNVLDEAQQIRMIHVRNTKL